MYKRQPVISEIGSKRDLVTGVFGIIIWCFAVWCFLYFFDIELGDSRHKWANFTQDCCGEFFNSTRCKINNECLLTFNKWLFSKGWSSRAECIENCCYWFAPYNQWKIQALPYCNPECLLSH